MGAGSLSRSDVVIRKGGIHTLRAIVTDEAGQVSTNACTAQVDVKGGFPIFAGGYFGKERLTHDDLADHEDAVASFSRCAPQVGFEVGIQPRIGANAEFEAALGVKFPFDDDAHTAVFADAAVNRLVSRGFFGGGISWWDIGRDSSGVGLLLQGGFDLDRNGKVAARGADPCAVLQASSTTSTTTTSSGAASASGRTAGSRGLDRLSPAPARAGESRTVVLSSELTRPSHAAVEERQLVEPIGILYSLPTWVTFIVTAAIGLARHGMRAPSGAAARGPGARAGPRRHPDRRHGGPSRVPPGFRVRDSRGALRHAERPRR